MKKSIVTLAAVITATLLLGCSSNLSAGFESETEGFENNGTKFSEYGYNELYFQKIE